MADETMWDTLTCLNRSMCPTFPGTRWSPSGDNSMNVTRYALPAPLRMVDTFNRR